MKNNDIWQTHVFIIGSKGIPAKYGGFEAFVEKLTLYKKNASIRYYVSCMADEYSRYEHNGAKCFNIKVPSIGSAKAVVYDILALKYFIRYIKEHNIQNPIIYILACRIGPFIKRYRKQIEKLGGHLYLNPDGHEWKRDKWNAMIKKYWKISEKLMVKHAEFVICDSKNIEKYIRKEYDAYAPETTFIAYGAETTKSKLEDNSEQLLSWYKEKGLEAGKYYLIVGRFVPENNYETMITEFMKSHTDKKLAIITNVEQNKFYKSLQEKTNFEQDKRIIFAGTVYDSELLKKIREGAFAYIHGHEVGGTNPSLLEALGSTRLNLLLGVGFNREVGEDGAVYWDKSEEPLSCLIDKADCFTEEELEQYGRKAKERIIQYYNWDYIVEQYENVFINRGKGYHK